MMGGVEMTAPPMAKVYRVYNDTDFDGFGEWYRPKGYWPFWCKNVTA